MRKNGEVGEPETLTIDSPEPEKAQDKEKLAADKGKLAARPRHVSQRMEEPLVGAGAMAQAMRSSIVPQDTTDSDRYEAIEHVHTRTSAHVVPYTEQLIFEQNAWAVVGDCGDAAAMPIDFLDASALEGLAARLRLEQCEELIEKMTERIHRRSSGSKYEGTILKGLRCAAESLMESIHHLSTN